MENLSSNPGPHRRRQYYIKKKFQGSFIIQFAILLVIGCISFGLAIYLYSTQTLTTAFVNSKLRVMSTADFLLPALILTAFIITTPLALAAAARLLILSHKIVGPLYRLEKSAEAVADGKLDFQVKIRSGDEMQDLACSMDVMVQKLRHRATEIRDQNQRLREVILEAKKNPSVPKDFLQVLETTQVKLDQAVNEFRV